ncbi:MAG: hypothetical protein P8Y70_16355 [Candidatus Lokiarchaeota archaeon]
MKRRNIYLIFILIGIILAAAVGPILGIVFSQVRVDQGPKKISDDSMIGFSERYSKGFSLSQDQTCHIEFSNYYPNTTVYLIILTKSEYGYYNSVNGSSPTSGQSFIVFLRQTGSSPTVYSGVTSLTIAWDGSTYGNYVYIEFRGVNRVSIPGSYYVVVRGQNNFAGNNEVRFNIKISIDGPGNFLQNIMILSGITLISITGLIWAADIIKRNLGER